MAKRPQICAGCALGLLLIATASAQPVPIGSEFQVNTYSTNDQLIPNLAARAGGVFVASWTDYFDPEDSNGRVAARRYDSAGVAQGSELEVSEQGYDAAVAVDGSGGFVVTWEHSNDVFGRRYDASGSPIGSAFQLNTYTTGVQGLSDVAMDSGGAFVAVWEQPYPDYTRAVVARRYDSAANPLGEAFRVNSITTGSHITPVVAASPGGAFVVAWMNVELPSGDAYVAARRYDSAGTPEGDQFQVDAGAAGVGFGPGVSIAPNGELVVVWVSDDGDGYGIFGQRYDDAGAPIGGAFQVNTYTTAMQTLAHAFHGLPRSRPVAHDGAGRFLIAWASVDQDGDEHGIFGRCYTSDGIPDGPEMQINSYATGAQHVPQVASAANGEFMVIWESAEQDGSGAGIFGQRLGIGATLTPGGTATPIPATNTPIANPCVGDCDRNGTVSIDELIRGVNIALELLGLDECPAFDADGDGVVGIGELILAVNAALGPCS